MTKKINRKLYWHHKKGTQYFLYKNEQIYLGQQFLDDGRFLIVKWTNNHNGVILEVIDND